MAIGLSNDCGAEDYEVGDPGVAWFRRQKGRRQRSIFVDIDQVDAAEDPARDTM
jgi:hypothetical protein